MGWKSIVAVIWLVALSYAPHASAAQPVIFEGVVATTAVTAECAGFAELHAQKALFRPHIFASDPNAAIVLGGDGPVNGLGQIQAQTKTSDMQGSGSYDGLFYDPQAGQALPWTGTYSLTVTPATVTARTIYVYVTGTISNFANVANCTLTINSAFVQPIGAH